MSRYQFNIDGMHCESCVAKIQTTLNALTSVSSCRVSLTDRRTVVAFAGENQDLAAVVKAIQQQGFTVTGYAAVPD